MTILAFRGGVHPPDFKEYAKDIAIQEAPVPDELIVPLSQHIGAPAKAVVKPGDPVKRGQKIGEAGGFVSAHIHSPVSGTVKAIVPTSHPVGLICDGIHILNDRRDEWMEECNVPTDVANLTPEAIREAVKNAGIVGMGGATFPTHVKLSPPKEKPIDTVILNGVECEPFLTADHRLMLESPRPILEGLFLIMKAVGARQGLIAIEANKPDAYRRIEQELATLNRPDISCVLLPVRYPQGAEKPLIYALTGREVPSGGLPMDIGVLVQNVGTAHAIYEAVAYRRPLTERIVTVTGPGVERPANFRARIGTPVRVLLEACGFRRDKTKKLILGGPMMGVAHFDTEIAVNKGMSGILTLVDCPIYPYRDCIRCGRCVEGCPAGLVPSQISILAERGLYPATSEWNVLDCFECGSCTYICPARRPIVQWIKVAKAELARLRAEQQKK